MNKKISNSMKNNKVIPIVEGMSFEKFCADVRKYSTLTEDEMAALIAKGDKKYINKLVEANMRIVISIAKKYQNYGVALEDLIQEGNFGLCKAANKFDPTRGKFITFAYPSIENAIKDFIEKNGTVVNFSNDRASWMKRINNFVSDFYITNGYNPCDEEIADGLGCSIRKVQECTIAQRNVVSLNKAICEDSDEPRADFIIDESDIIDRWHREDDRKVLVNLMRHRLSDVEFNVMIRKFGFISGIEESNEVIALRIGVSEESVRRILKRAFAKLKDDTEFRDLLHSMVA